MKSDPWELHLSHQEKTLLALVGVTSVLLWIVLIFSLVSLYGLPFAAAGAITTAKATTVPKGVHAFALPNAFAHADEPSSSMPTSPPAEGSSTLSPTLSPLPTGGSPALSPTPSPAPTKELPTRLPPTFTPTPTPIPTRLPGVSPLPLGDDTFVIALLGIDEKQTAGVWRTDSIVLAFVQLEAKRIALLSIPRDLWVYVPGHGYDRVNIVDALGERTHYPGGGRGLLDKTLRHNLGVPVGHYVRIDFQGFVRVVDALGGVTVNVEKSLTDKFPDPLSPTGSTTITLPVGPRHMDGRTALKYCRSRMTTDDFDRSRRQLQVLRGLLKQAFTPEKIAQAPNLWMTFNDVFETDISMVEAILLASFVQGIEAKDVRSKNLDFDTARPWTTPGGAQVLLPQTDAIQQIILDLLSAGD